MSNEHGKISHEAVMWHFLRVLDEARQRLAFTEGWLRKSADFEGHPHQAWIEVTARKVRSHLDKGEQEIKTVPSQEGGTP